MRSAWLRAGLRQRGKIFFALLPGVETPGYYQSSPAGTGDCAAPTALQDSSTSYPVLPHWATLGSRSALGCLCDEVLSECRTYGALIYHCLPSPYGLGYRCFALRARERMR